MHVRAGEIVACLGPNGAGQKTNQLLQDVGLGQAKQAVT